MIERTCKKCGKTFIPAPMHRYVDGDYIYCSWTCFNHRKDGKQTERKKYKRVEVYDKTGDLLRKFDSANDAAEFTGFGVNYIRNACRDGKTYQGFIWKYKDD